MKTFQTYPEELRRLEAEAVTARRHIVDRSEKFQSPSDTDSALASEIPKDAVGLALSGGGIRSATFCLGFLQALAQRRLLRRIDFLSTVSGGGYIGSFLGRFFDRLRDTPQLAPDIVEQSVRNPASTAVSWLRSHGEFLAPAGSRDINRWIGIVSRNLLTLYLVLGTLIFALFGFVNGVRFGLLEYLSSLAPYFGSFNWNQMPIGYLVHHGGLGHFWSPWLMLVEAMFLAFALPSAIGFWLASQEEAEAYNRPTLIVVFALLGALLCLGLAEGLNTLALWTAVPLLLSFLAVEWAWRDVRRDNAALGTGGPGIEQLRARMVLTRDWSTWLAIVGVVAYFALIDTLAHALYERHVNNQSYTAALGRLTAMFAVLVPALRAIARKIDDVVGSRRSGGIWGKLFSIPTISGLIACLLAAPPLLALSFASHALYQGGIDGGLGRGWLVTGFALALSFVIARPWALALVNRTSLQSTYSARIARAYLGASNPNRSVAGSDEVVPGDDVVAISQYRPHEAGGPLHLINVCVNQTVELGSLRSVGTRLGVGLSCSSFGMSIGRFHHALWKAGPIGGTTISAIAHAPGTLHPLLDANEQPPDRIDEMPLRTWISISGAAFGTGMGANTSRAAAILFLLTNMRTGYWWNSTLTAGDRGARPRVSFVRRVLWLLPGLFETQSRLLHEAFARFHGPWQRLWYLSDGGHFENLGVYELIRRRLPFVIAVDAGADPEIELEDFANLERKIRIDFQAEIEPFGESAWNERVEADINRLPPESREAAHARAMWDKLRQHVSVGKGDGGPFDRLELDVRPGRLGPTVNKHAALFRVRYANSNAVTILLYVKTTLSGDEPTDVLSYHIKNSTFPHENTSDQFFSEPQWESYRRLGEHIGDLTLGTPNDDWSSSLWLKRLAEPASIP